MLNDVNWETLAYQLNLQDQVDDIQDECNSKTDKRPCYFREVVSRYIQSQPEESCDNTRRKIVKALEELHYVNEASRLRELILGELYQYNIVYVGISIFLFWFRHSLLVFPTKLKHALLVISPFVDSPPNGTLDHMYNDDDSSNETPSTISGNNREKHGYIFAYSPEQYLINIIIIVTKCKIYDVGMAVLK